MTDRPSPRELAEQVQAEAAPPTEQQPNVGEPKRLTGEPQEGSQDDGQD